MTPEQALDKFTEALHATHKALNDLVGTTGQVGPIGRHGTVASERLGEAHYWACQIVNYHNSSIQERMEAAAAAGKLQVVDGGKTDG